MCADCEVRRKLARDAWLQARVGEALGHVAKGAAEMVGLKPKTGGREIETKQARFKRARRTE